MHATYFIQLEVTTFQSLHSIHVHAIFDFIDGGTCGICIVLQEELLASIHRFLIHPHQHRLKIPSDIGKIVRTDDHLTTRDINLVLEGKGDTLGAESFLELTIVGDNTLHMAPFHRRQSYHLVSLADDTAGYLAAESSEIEIGTKDVLDRITEIFHVAVQMNGYCLQKIQKGRTIIPGSMIALFHNIVTLQRAQGYTGNIIYAKGFRQIQVFLFDVIEDFF